jgi:hypothetical protein
MVFAKTLMWQFFCPWCSSEEKSFLNTYSLVAKKMKRKLLKLSEDAELLNVHRILSDNGTSLRQLGLRKEEIEGIKWLKLSN